MKHIKLSWFIYLLVISFLMPKTSYAHLENLSFQELVKRSNYIFAGEVLKTKKRWNGSMLADVRVEQQIKGSPNGNMSVSYGQAYNKAKEDLTQLKVGCRYVFYIINVEKTYHLFGVRGKDYYLINNNNVMCDGKQIALEICLKKIRSEAYYK